MWIIFILVVSLVVFLMSRKSNSKQVDGSIFDKVEKMEKEHLFKEYYEEYKDYEIEELNDLIESNRKSNYDDYSVEDKMEFKAQKTLIEEKTQVARDHKMDNTIRATVVNTQLLNTAIEKFNTENTMESIIHSLSFVDLKDNGIDKVDIYPIKLKEILSPDEALALYAEIIENENTTLLTYVNTAKRISMILGKEKLYLTDYFFLANAWTVITKFHNNGYHVNCDVYEIAERLLKAEKKTNKLIYL